LGGAAVGAVGGAIVGGTAGAVGGGVGGSVVPVFGTGLGALAGGTGGASEGALVGGSVGSTVGALVGGLICSKPHDSNKTPSNRPKHERGTARKRGSRGPSTHPKYPPRVRPFGWKGPWPPK
jgi:hypothetical protein